jgi:3-oxoacyl-[acyl-carrier protein] reductase
MKSKMSKYFRNFIEYLKKGGVTSVTVSTISPGARLAGKTALITGGSSGIGFAIAKIFLSQGASVIISGRSEQALVDAKNAINSEQLYTVCGDISNIGTLDSFWLQCLKIAPREIDLLVNNAGVYTEKNISNMTETEWDRVIDTNLKGLYFMCQKYLAYAIAGSIEAKIINISSNRSILGDDGPYGPSKWGVNSLTRGLAKNFLPHGIIINGIAPGGTTSKINNVNSDGNLYSTVNGHNRLLIGEEVAELALFLASDISNSIVGQTIVIDGGATL